ncbi:MAG: transposase [Myxococcales bacterium]|nr:transposase [Myxococcales bacterium]
MPFALETLRHHPVRRAAAIFGAGSTWARRRSNPCGSRRPSTAADAEAQQTPEQRIASLEAQLADATRTITRLRDQYTRALEKLVLMQRRLVVTSAERRFETSTDQLELELRVTEVAALKKKLDAAEKAAGAAPTDEAPSKPSATSPSAKKTDGRKKRATAPTGRRGAELAELPKIYAPVIDPELEGKAERIGFVESYKLGHERGGPRCIVVQIAVHKKTVEVTPQATSPSPHMDTSAPTGCRIVRARRPLEMIRRGMLAPSMIAYLLVQKYLMGLPFHRLEQQFARQGFSLDRGTMARYSEEIGSMLGLRCRRGARAGDR